MALREDRFTQKADLELGSLVEGHLPGTYVALGSILALTTKETRTMARACVSAFKGTVLLGMMVKTDVLYLITCLYLIL